MRERSRDRPITSRLRKARVEAGSFAICETSRRDATSSSAATSRAADADRLTATEARADVAGRLRDGATLEDGAGTATDALLDDVVRLLLLEVPLQALDGVHVDGDMWFRTSVTPIDWNSPTTALGSRFSCFATS